MDAIKSLAAIGELVEEVEVSGKRSGSVVSHIEQKDVSVFSSQHCLNSLSKE